MGPCLLLLLSSTLILIVVVFFIFLHSRDIFFSKVLVVLGGVFLPLLFPSRVSFFLLHLIIFLRWGIVFRITVCSEFSLLPLLFGLFCIGFLLLRCILVFGLTVCSEFSLFPLLFSAPC